MWAPVGVDLETHATAGPETGGTTALERGATIVRRLRRRGLRDR